MLAFRYLCIPTGLLFLCLCVAVGCDTASPAFSPEAPDSLNARLVRPDVVAFGWKANGQYEGGLTVQRSKNGGPLTELAQVATGTTTYYDTVSTQGDYRYSVIPTRGFRGNEAPQSEKVEVTGWMRGAPRNEDARQQDESSVRIVELGDRRLLFVSPKLAEIYDPFSQQWDPVPHPGKIRIFDDPGGFVRLIPLDDGRAFYMGLSIDDGRIPLAVFNPSSNSWTSIDIPPFSDGFVRFSSVHTYMAELTDGRILLVGRKGRNGRSTPFAMTWSPGDAAFQEIASPPFLHSLRPVVNLLNQQAILFGSRDECALFDGTTSTWQELHPCPPGGAPSALLPDGRVLTFGENSDRYSVYSPDRSEWRTQPFPTSVTGGYSKPRRMATLPDGRVMAFFWDWAFFDPRTDEWRQVETRSPYPINLEGMRSGGPFDVVGVSYLARDVFWYRYLPAGD